MMSKNREQPEKSTKFMKDTLFQNRKKMIENPYRIDAHCTI